ncbi:hypothetical protein [Nitrosomonas sp. Is37]|uniref:hypothetical protein n=1 Tax=Nitrosomonas sp. Is37 TaxID=3080535 RepID=UPI00294AB784|nr:hypothetical protein [Nitrosomonas sp. Is37]MDV6345669.1 hypothetical protein [Nitrosomonas sp. Is37]
MRKTRFLYLTAAFLVMTLNETAWGYDGYNYYDGYGYYPDGYSLGLGLGYGSSIIGYPYYYGYGVRRYGGYGFGYPYYYRPYYGGYGPYYYPPIYVVPPTPPVYIQQPSTVQPPSPPETNYWHYCENPAGYYPYVKKCLGGWLKVPPQPKE